MIVLHRGRIELEAYRNGMTPTTRHIAMSVSKSITSLITGVLANQGLIDLRAEVTRYVPELAGTAYQGATIQHLLDNGSVRVLFTVSPSWGHIHPMVPLARAFGDVGDAVLWATASDVIPRLEREGFQAAATSGARRSESMPGWWRSRSRQNRAPRLNARLCSVVWSSMGWRSCR